MSLRSPDYPATLSLDGTVRFGGEIGVRYDGTALLVGTPPNAATAQRSPWSDFRASGKFDLTPDALRLVETQVSYGAIERPLILEASGTLEFSGEPRFDVSVSARQIDLDRTLGGGADEPVSIEAAISALSAALPRLRLPPLPGVLRLDAQGVVLGGSVIQAVGVDLATAHGVWEIENLGGDAARRHERRFERNPQRRARAELPRPCAGGIAASSRLRVLVAGRDRICGEDRPLRGRRRYRYWARRRSAHKSPRDDSVPAR